MRHKLTVEEQIRGVRKALANRKTPKQFLPAMRERLKQLERQRERAAGAKF